MIKTMQLLHAKEPMWTRHASKMLSLLSGQMDQQVVTSCVIIQQSNHGWNRTTVDKLCHVYQSEGEGLLAFLKDVLCILSLPFCATKAGKLYKQILKMIGEKHDL